MAQSPAHRFGQIMGDALETAVEPILEEFARQHNLYLDRKGIRPARQGKKLTWRDMFGNAHDLDFVLERGGADSQVGTPVAFIETAWRSYTKHSRNKAQEIQGAIQPLLLTYSDAAPFAGVILAGVFTQGALNQLRSLKFNVLYFPYDTVIRAFELGGIDASFSEATPDSELPTKVHAWEALNTNSKLVIMRGLITLNEPDMKTFMDALSHAVDRYINSITVLPLHGISSILPSVQEAIAFIEGYHEGTTPEIFARYEVSITYNTGDKIEAKFARKEDTISFLRQYLPPIVELANRI